MSTDAARPKTGVFTGAYALNPVTDERIPIWIADYVLIGVWHRSDQWRCRRATTRLRIRARV